MGIEDFFNFAAPGTTGGPQQTIPGGPTGDQDFSGGQAGPSIWDKLMAGIGQGKPLGMPGTTIGAPAGASPAMMGSPVSPMIPQTQMPRPPGIPNLSALLNPTAGGAGNQGLMAQYMALQQLMRG